MFDPWELPIGISRDMALRTSNADLLSIAFGKQFMNKNSDLARRKWATPELHRIDAGSAEAKKGTGIADGGAGGNDKS